MAASSLVAASTGPPTGWVDTHVGWDTLIASLIIAGVTIVYVYLSWRLLRAERQTMRVAQYANELARQALLADHQQYAMALQNRQDAGMPALTVRFTATAIHRRGATPQQTLNVGTVTREEFKKTGLSINSSFHVVNYGPGPALLWVEATTDHEFGLSDGRDSSLDLKREPAIIPPTSSPIIIELSVVTDGLSVFERFIGKSYSEIRFKWSGLAQRDVFDSASFTLRATAQQLVSDPVDNAFLSRVFSQEPTFLLAADRTYPSSGT